MLAQSPKFLYLHIGLPKAGSSSLQTFLAYNADVLAERGIFYPNLAKPDTTYSVDSGCDCRNGNAYPFAYSYLEDQSITICPISGITLDCIDSVLRNSEDHVLLSSEWLVLLPSIVIRELSSLCLKHGFTLKVISYVRRQDFLVESRYSQRTKIAAPLSLDFVCQVAPHFLKKTIYKFAMELGDETIAIRPLEKCQLKNGNLYEDFLSCINIDDTTSFEPPQHKVNRSLSHGVINMLDEMNKHGITNSHARELFVTALENNPEDTSHDTNTTWLSPEKRLEILNNVSEMNSDVAKRFLHRSDGVLFYEPPFNTDKPWSDAHSIRVTSQYIDGIVAELVVHSDDPQMRQILSYLETYKEKLQYSSSHHDSSDNKHLPADDLIEDNQDAISPDHGIGIESNTISIQGKYTTPTILQCIREYWLIRKSGLFMSLWYTTQYPHTHGYRHSLLLHYIRNGASEGLNPNPLFDTVYYLEQNPDVASARFNPLLHYYLFGAKELRNPSPKFNTQKYLEAYPDVVTFGMNPLQHYLRHGVYEGRTIVPVLA